ncbi:MAG TPA: glycerophosphodiester phosphodiesterase family protein [Jatrophihabitantaceae bacterium]
MNTRPLVVAHRGASFDIAEHTLSAYTAAIESGADALECDVRLTRDGHLVCVHDRRVDRTSDGRGLVSELDLAGLDALDFSSWHRVWPDAADQLLGDEPYLAGVAPDRRPDGGVLTLDVLLGLVRDAPRPVRLLVETKHPTRYGGLVEKELVKLLAKYGWAGQPGPVSSVRRRPVPPTDGRVTVMSFAPTALRRVRLLAPDVPTVLLLERLTPGRRDGSLPVGVGIAGPSLATLRAAPRFVSRAHAKGNRVYVWTVDDPDDVGFVLGLGVDAVITNRPAAVMAQLLR